MTPWKLPLIVAALAVPIVVAFALGGGAAGVACGALAVAALIVIAVRQRPIGPIGTEPQGGPRRRVLLIVTCPVETPAEVQRVAAAAGLGEGARDAEVLALAPARIGFLDRWASDVEGAREEAQKNLVVTVAALARAGIAAEARVGDEDVVQAVEDQLQSFVADDVVLIGDGEPDESAVAELEARLRAGFRQVSVSGG
jgi:hypothetical protein